MVMKTTVEAIFEGGVFKPVKAPELPEGQRVQITVERVPRLTPTEILGLAADVYRGLSTADIEEIEDMARRRAFFTRESV
jgi:predicted DNA-binding antitoxin AbrB/MazE fold protein